MSTGKRKRSNAAKALAAAGVAVGGVLATPTVSGDPWPDSVPFHL